MSGIRIKNVIILNLTIFLGNFILNDEQMFPYWIKRGKTTNRLILLLVLLISFYYMFNYIQISHRETESAKFAIEVVNLKLLIFFFFL